MERHREMLSDGCKAMFGTDKPAAATESSVFGERAARASKPIDSEVQARLRNRLAGDRRFARDIEVASELQGA
jgi:hypothetical protein